jgi:hypothetical protein
VLGVSAAGGGVGREWRNSKMALLKYL